MLKAILEKLGPYSNKAFLVIAFSIFIASFVYYPKWNKSYSEATLSWDVSGYYIYLPAIFIYKDLKKLSFHNAILDEYGPTPDFQQAYGIENGNRVCKYTSGMAIQYLPFFGMAHIYAKLSSHKADGYSRPYQFMIHTGSYIYGMIGLYFLFLILSHYFRDKIVAATCLCIALASNYLEYVGITNAMAHNYLLMWYAILIHQTIRFKQNPTNLKAILLGVICGVMALTRPTEIISILIPLFWGFSFSERKQHLSFLWDNKSKIIYAAISCFLVGSIQLLYWKYVSGSFLQYSYEDQGFSWLAPHIYEGLFHFKAGWLIYSPIMICSLIGLFYLRNKKEYGFVSVVYSLLFIYIAFAWDIWWYGGSLGQRTMVQVIPVLAFPFAAFLSHIFSKSNGIRNMIIFAGLCVFGNLWVTHHAHKGKYFYPERMTQSFYLHAFGKNKINAQANKLLHTRRINEDFRTEVNTILSDEMDSDKLNTCQSNYTDGKSAFCLDEQEQFTPRFIHKFEHTDFDWIRVNANCKLLNKEHEKWKHTQLYVEFKSGPEEKVIRKRMISLNQYMQENQFNDVFIDVKKPNKNFDRLDVFLWHAGSNKKFILNKIWIETYNS